VSTNAIDKTRKDNLRHAEITENESIIAILPLLSEPPPTLFLPPTSQSKPDALDLKMPVEATQFLFLADLVVNLIGANATHPCR
jgi:hypothetical protein